MVLADDARSRLDEAWQQYHSTGDPDAKALIVKSYMPLVERIARDIMRKKPSNFEKEDLVQAGVIGLMNAIDRFEPERGILFSTFAPLRVRGAIYDEINGMDWTPRLVRERIKLVIRATETHFRENQHTPSSEEIALITEDMGKPLTPAQVREAQEQANKTHVHAVDNTTVIETEERQTGVGLDMSTEYQGATLEEIVQLRDRRSKVWTIIRNTCTEEEIRILVDIFYYEKSMRAIAEETGLPASKVSEIKKRALKKITDMMHRSGLNSSFDA